MTREWEAIIVYIELLIILSVGIQIFHTVLITGLSIESAEADCVGIWDFPALNSDICSPISEAQASSQLRLPELFFGIQIYCCGTDKVRNNPTG